MLGICLVQVYIIDQETTVQPAAGVGGPAPVSTCVYSSLLLHSKVRVVGLDDRAMSLYWASQMRPSIVRKESADQRDATQTCTD